MPRIAQNMEKTYLQKENPDGMVDDEFIITFFCPSDLYGPGHDPQWCHGGSREDCERCWNRPFQKN